MDKILNDERVGNLLDALRRDRTAAGVKDNIIMTIKADRKAQRETIAALEKKVVVRDKAIEIVVGDEDCTYIKHRTLNHEPRMVSMKRRDGSPEDIQPIIEKALKNALELCEKEVG